MSNFTPTAAEIVEAAIARNFGTLTLGQAEAIRRQLLEIDGPGYEPGVWLEFAMLGAQHAHNDNVAMLAAATVEDIEPPKGFDERQDWAVGLTGRIVRWWDKEIPTDTDATVLLTVTDEIVDNHVVRYGPDVHVSVEGNYTSNELLCLAHAPITASDLLSQHGGR